MRDIFEKAYAKWQRDRERLSVATLVQKTVRYGSELAWAPVRLRDVDFRGPGVRTLGKPRIDNQGTMRIGGGTLIRSVNVPVELATGPNGTLTIGRNCRLNYGVSIGVLESITLGDRVRVGPYAMIIDCEFHDVYDRDKTPPPRPVTLEDDVWIGAKASVLPGVRIGRGAIIGTAAVVTEDVPPFTIAVGVPARVVKELDPSRFVVRDTAR